ncbi:MAG: hypothetical protein L6R39_006128 [Caloplaca ligustica]|nr:MAG: hypothetical protein L6R39_006128 [Caloplaca ligustica]
MSTKPDTPSTFPASKRKSRVGFLDLFVSQTEIDKLRKELQLRQDRKQAAAAATAAATAATAAPDPTPAADPAPEAPKPDEAAKPAEDAKPAEEAAKTPFTPAEDVALLSLKGQNKPWKEIAEVLVGRDKDELRHRYKEIGGVVGGNAGEAGKQGATVEPVKEGAAPAQPNQGKGNKGKQQKGEGGKKGKGKQDEAAKPEEKKDEPAAAAAAAVPAPAPTNPNEAVVADKKDAKIKGILRRGSDGALQFGEAVIPDGATTLNGCPIIYLEENDPLDVYELSFLYNMNCTFEEERWIRMASRFFDRTGKRIEPEWLKEKLKNCM